MNMYYTEFVLSSVDGHLDYFYFPITENVARQQTFTTASCKI